MFAVPASASSGGWSVSGRILNEAGTPISSASIHAAGETHSVDESGNYRIDVEAQDLVSLHVRADGYYGFIHTLHDSDAAGGKIEDLDIELVAREPERRLLLFAGDAMLARRYFDPRPGEPVLVRKGHVLEDGKQLLEVIRPYIQLADYASVNVETQMSSIELTQRLPKSYTFYSPPELAEILQWAGFDYAALGNNHTWDYQEQGLVPTLAALDAAGLDYSGAGLDEASARKAQSVELGDQPYRFLSYVGWAGLFSPTQAASGAKGGAALGNSEVFAEDLGIVDPGTVAVLQYHSGIEYTEDPAISERMRLRQAIDFGADIAIGHHPHVLHGLEIYKDRLIAYSMGNFLFDQFDYATQMAMLVYVWMDGDTLHRAEVVPVNVNGYLPTPATGRFRDAILHRLARTSRPLGTCLRPNGVNVVVDRCADGAAGEVQDAAVDTANPASV
ncbi:MAG: CapA family protein, partial [Gammaproteobacteria bacterium]|nr:CapA family protein [Gammaproteobacteria bacterium]